MLSNNALSQDSGAYGRAIQRNLKKQKGVKLLNEREKERKEKEKGERNRAGVCMYNVNEKKKYPK